MSAKQSPPAGVATPTRSLSWRRWIEPWYLAYALQGATAAGLIPIVVPLVVSRAGSPADVGIVMAALSLGGLTAPLWGTLADRYRLHRWLLAESTDFSVQVEGEE